MPSNNPPPTQPQLVPDSSDAQLDADRIRLKRLAKLGGSLPNSNPPPNQRPQQDPKPLGRPTAKLPTSSASNSVVVPKAGPSTPAKRPPSNTSQPPRSVSSKLVTPVTPLTEDQLRRWQHNLISNILKVTLDESAAAESHWSLTYLLKLKEELEEEESGSSKLMTMDIIDRVLIARLSLDSTDMTDDPMMLTVYASLPNESIFEYLSTSWLRAMEERAKVVASKLHLTERLPLIDQAKELLISYIGLTIQDPAMFRDPQPLPQVHGTTQLMRFLTEPPPGHPLIPHIWTLIHELAQRFHDDGLEEIIGPVLSQITLDNNLRLSIWHVGGHEWRVPVRVVGELMEVKAIAKIVPKLREWMPLFDDAKDAGRRIEIFWLLGPVLALSTFPDRAPAIAKEYFNNPNERPRADLDSATTSLQQTLNSLQLSLYNIFDRIVRAGPESREAVLKLWAQAIKLNAKRGAMHVDRGSVASDGVIINIQAVLLQFAGPFLDPQFSKIEKVDPLYFKHSNRLDIREETKINANKQEFEIFLAEEEMAQSTPVNFISEIFFLNVAIFRLGILHVSKNWDKRARDIDDMKKELARLKDDHRWDGTPHEATFKNSVEKFQKELYSREAKLLAYEVQMCDPEFLAKCNSFCSFVMTWCVRMVDPIHQHPKTPIKLPLPPECPTAFRMLPEYVLEDVIEFYSFVSRHSPPTLLQSSVVIDELLTFTLVFLTTPYLKNYHLKSKFIEILYFNTRPVPGRPNGVLGDSLNYHPLSLKHLMPALMQIYIEVEITGSHSQFYDKFYSRRYIALILRKVWDNQTHRRALKVESSTESFVRFANLLMNDVTFLLDDTLSQLQEVHRIETKMADKEAWEALSEADRKDEESKLHQAERQCPAFLSLANENVNMLKTFTEETPEAFLKSEIVVRLAAMLDYNLNTLAGPACQTLKVKDANKFNFHPKTLLADLVQVYLNLSNRSAFQQAIAQDGRSYTKELFERVDWVARKASLKTEAELAKLKTLVEAVEELKQLEADEEEELGDIPDEFLDPVMATLMKDPVILPTSKTTVDMSTIKQHFLSDATDPFNRMPLKIEDILPDEQLKARITAWLAEKKAEKKAEKMQE
ncbi:hypothetical protein CROQUDRAFT_660243 [Cronartium quercuum f. sp. fusiforme G11]|uniref:RING-type E3 ubiquitin transferase n=1 Tax=Cronartium quercuum f. sp. fusiforme G11 TaxID=708437 RepID=A0A9P6NIJ2_9BASI|nr:hypothetical protein CROQUDRAFT_660243 [Cronartium quercuum f. sp. fusiforme G11]